MREFGGGESIEEQGREAPATLRPHVPVVMAPWGLVLPAALAKLPGVVAWMTPRMPA